VPNSLTDPPVRDPACGYFSVSFPESDGLEITCWI
jgi:hypothetical protein